MAQHIISEGLKNVNEEELRERTIRELTYVSQMDVKEYTLYQKWCEIKDISLRNVGSNPILTTVLSLG